MTLPTYSTWASLTEEAQIEMESQPKEKSEVLVLCNIQIKF